MEIIEDLLYKQIPGHRRKEGLGSATISDSGSEPLASPDPGIGIERRAPAPDVCFVDDDEKLSQQPRASYQGHELTLQEARKEGFLYQTEYYHTRPGITGSEDEEEQRRCKGFQGFIMFSDPAFTTEYQKRVKRIMDAERNGGTPSSTDLSLVAATQTWIESPYDASKRTELAGIMRNQGINADCILKHAFVIKRGHIDHPNDRVGSPVKPGKPEVNYLNINFATDQRETGNSLFVELVEPQAHGGSSVSLEIPIIDGEAELDRANLCFSRIEGNRKLHWTIPEGSRECPEVVDALRIVGRMQKIVINHEEQVLTQIPDLSTRFGRNIRPVGHGMISGAELDMGGDGEGGPSLSTGEPPSLGNASERDSNGSDSEESSVASSSRNSGRGVRGLG